MSKNSERCPEIFVEMSQNQLQPSEVTEIISKINAFGETSAYFKSPLENKFDWQRIKNPIQKNSIQNTADFKSKLIKFMKKDVAQSKQGNLQNPLKAACDGVWRDLRPVIIYAVGKGGVHAECLKIFIKYYLPLHNRIGDGPSIEVIESIIHGLEIGFIRTDYFYESQIELNEASRELNIKGPFGETVADCIILGMIDLYKASYENNPLYKNLLKTGFPNAFEKKKTKENDIFPIY